MSGFSIQDLNDMANHVSSVLVVYLFLKALPPMVGAVLGTLENMKAKDVERFKMLSEMWERQFKLLYGELKDDRRNERD